MVVSGRAYLLHVVGEVARTAHRVIASHVWGPHACTLRLPSHLASRGWSWHGPTKGPAPVLRWEAQPHRCTLSTCVLLLEHPSPGLHDAAPPPIHHHRVPAINRRGQPSQHLIRAGFTPVYPVCMNSTHHVHSPVQRLAKPVCHLSDSQATATQHVPLYIYIYILCNHRKATKCLSPVDGANRPAPTVSSTSGPTRTHVR